MPPDRAESIERCVAAARLGDAEAQFQLGVIYCTGAGLPQDLGAATGWYRRAAEQGHRYAAHNLAVMLLQGDGIEANPTAAFQWSRRAAEAGVPEAELMVGNLYAAGLGTTPDPVKARQWYARAAARGNAIAAAKLQPLDTAPRPISAPVRPSEAARHDLSVGTGTLAIMTMVYNESVNLPIWIAHYRRVAPSAALFVIDHGSEDGSAERLSGVNKIPLPRTKMDELDRVFLVNSLQHALLRYYDLVIYTDCDELLVPDPLKAATLDRYLRHTRYQYASPIGLNVVHMIEEESPLDPTRPLLQQRRYAQFDSFLCKPVVTRVPLNWQPGFHSCDRPLNIDTDLYLFHTKQIDKDRALQRQRIARSVVWSQQAVEANLGAHHRIDDEDFLRGFFLDPANQLREQGIRPFAFETQIAKLHDGTRSVGGITHIPAFRGPIVEIPERFRSAF